MPAAGCFCGVRVACGEVQHINDHLMDSIDKILERQVRQISSFREKEPCAAHSSVHPFRRRSTCWCTAARFSLRLGPVLH